MGKTQLEAQGARISELRDAALAYVMGSGSDFMPHAGSEELDAMGLSGEDLLKPDYLEARILLNVGQKKRVVRIQKLLYRLFQKRESDHEATKFYAFQDRLKEVEIRGYSLGGVSFFYSFAAMDHEQVWADTKAAIESVKSLIGDAFLNSGTLLGSVREKGLIPHDDDVDIAVILKANTAADAAREWIDVYHKLQAKNLISKPPKRNYGVFKLKSTVGINIDVFPAWIENDRVFIYPYASGELSTNDVLPLGRCSTTKLPIPNNAEAVLAVNYGENWHIPDPGFTFQWGRANRRFSAFRDVLNADETVWDLG